MLGLVSVSNSKGVIFPSSTVHIVISCFAVSQECLSKRIGHITLKTFLGNYSDQNSINDGLGGPMGSRYKAIKQYNKSENKCKK